MNNTNTKKYKGKDYFELWNFITAYFGDFWEGRTEREIIDEAVRISTNEYLLTIHSLLIDFLNLDISIEEKWNFLLSTNVYFKTPKQAVEWLNTLEKLIKERVHDI